MATLLTVLKGGGRYTPLWVEYLKNGAMRHAAGFETIVCLTDLDFQIDGVETIPLKHDWPIWWSKFEAFRSDIGSGVKVLCDLDTVFAANASALIANDMAAMEDYFLKGRLSTALMRWKDDELSFLYDTFRADPHHWMQEGSCGPVPNSVHGDQVVVDHLLRRDGKLPPFFQQRHSDLLDFYDEEHTEFGPVLIFIGKSKPDTANAMVRALWQGRS